jgi:hypothetical protein
LFVIHFINLEREEGEVELWRQRTQLPILIAAASVTETGN